MSAPFDGMITARNLNPGALVGSAAASGTSSSAIFEIATLKPLRVYLYLPQPFSPLVHDGDAAVVTVSEYPKRDFVGTITRHPAALDQSTRTMQVEVDLPNDDLALYPGMYANVTVTVRGAKQSPRVPDQALIFNNEDVLRAGRARQPDSFGQGRARARRRDQLRSDTWTRRRRDHRARYGPNRS